MTLMNMSWSWFGKGQKKEENQSEVRLDGPGLARFSLVSGPVIGMERVGVAVLRILETY